METNKKKVYDGTSQVQAMGFRNALTNAGITYHEVDKSDSAYIGLFDEIHIYVDDKDEVEALAILQSLDY